MTVKRATQRQRKERTAETRFVLWSLCRYTIIVSILYSYDGKGATYHWDESNREIRDTQNCNSDAAS